MSLHLNTFKKLRVLIYLNLKNIIILTSLFYTMYIFLTIMLPFLISGFPPTHFLFYHDIWFKLLFSNISIDSKLDLLLKQSLLTISAYSQHYPLPFWIYSLSLLDLLKQIPISLLISLNLIIAKFEVKKIKRSKKICNLSIVTGFFENVSGTVIWVPNCLLCNPMVLTQILAPFFGAMIGIALLNWSYIVSFFVLLFFLFYNLNRLSF
ncbi:hypothetical protein HRbin06_00249 [archaeon HR06]|nr:hypothetical protein HRbin06_00249 [archaeon HR06]